MVFEWCLHTVFWIVDLLSQEIMRPSLFVICLSVFFGFNTRRDRPTCRIGAYGVYDQFVQLKKQDFWSKMTQNRSQRSILRNFLLKCLSRNLIYWHFHGIRHDSSHTWTWRVLRYDWFSHDNDGISELNLLQLGNKVEFNAILLRNASFRAVLRTELNPGEQSHSVWIPFKKDSERYGKIRSKNLTGSDYNQWRSILVHLHARVFGRKLTW
jgi:hypothetical protein